jgi:hypothetical protein
MEELDGIRKFQYRQPRLRTGFDVDFIAGEETFHGLCRDVGDAGIRAEFDGSVIAGSIGLLILRHPTGVLKVDAQVTYNENDQVGLVFHFQTPWQRKLTIEFLASITNYLGTSLVVPLP